MCGGRNAWILERNREDLINTVNEVLKIRDDIDIESDGALSDEHLTLLTKMRAKILSYDSRSSEMAYDIASTLFPSLITQEEWADKIGNEITDTEKAIQADEEKKQELEAKGEEPSTLLNARIEQLKEELKKAGAAKAQVDDIVKLLHAITDPREIRSRREARAYKRGMRTIGTPVSRLINAEEIQEILTNPRTVAELLKLVNASKELNTLTYRDKERLTQEILDLHDLSLQKLEYNKKFREFIGDPSLINESSREYQNAASRKLRDNKVKDLALKIKEASTMTDLDKLIRETPEIDPGIAKEALEKARKDSSDDVRSFLDDYQKASDFFEKLQHQVKKLPSDVLESVLNTVMNEWNDAMAKGIDAYETFGDGLRASVASLRSTKDPFHASVADAIEKTLSDLDTSRSNTATNAHTRQTASTPSSAASEESADEGDAATLAAMRGRRGRTASASSAASESAVSPDDTLEDVKTLVKDNFRHHGGAEKISDLASDTSKRIQAYNSKHPDAPITDDMVKLWYQEYVDEQIANEGDFDIDDVEGAESNEDGDGSTRGREMAVDLRENFKSDRPSRYQLLDEGLPLDHKVPYTPPTAQLKTVQKILDEYGAYDFIDHNWLGYLFKNNPDLEVRFIKSTDKAVNGNNANEAIIFLGVKIGDKEIEAINKGSGKDVRNILKLVEINGEQYQLVGTLTFQGDGTVTELSKAFGELQHAINSELNPMMDDARNNNQPFVISERLFTNIHEIYTGRLEKKAPDGSSVDKVSLYDFMTQKGDSSKASSEWEAGMNFHFGVVLENSESVSDDIPVDRVEPNPEWMAKNRGAILLYVPRPDGRLYPVRCTRRTVRQWLDSTADGQHTGLELLNSSLGSSGASNAFLGSILSNLRVLFDDSSSFQKKLNAKVALSRYFIFGKSSPIHVDDVNATVTVRINKEDVTLPMGDVENDIQAFFKFLADQNVMFTLPSPTSKESSHYSGRDVISSGILEIGLNGFYNFNANFTVLPIDANNNLVSIKVDPDTLEYTNNPDRELEISFDFGEGKETFLVSSDSVRYKDSGKLVETDKKNLILQALETHKVGNKVPLLLAEQIAPRQRNPEIVKFIAEGLGMYDGIYVLYGEGGVKWLYDSRNPDHDARFYKVDATDPDNKGVQLIKEINAHISQFTSDNFSTIKSMKEAARNASPASSEASEETPASSTSPAASESKTETPASSEPPVSAATDPRVFKGMGLEDAPVNDSYPIIEFLKSQSTDEIVKHVIFPFLKECDDLGIDISSPHVQEVIESIINGPRDQEAMETWDALTKELKGCN